jgi:glucokinase
VSDRIIGVDVGGTKVAVAALEGSALSESTLMPTEHSSTEAFLDQLCGLVADMGDAAAVGLAVPSVVEFATGTARFSVNVPLQGVPLREVLGERLGMPVFVDNDATCAALAEAIDDDGEPVAQVLVMFTLGTGVGGGVVMGGRIFRGATGAAPELGHMIVAADLREGAPPAASQFPHPASIEAWATGGALGALGRARGFPDGEAVARAAERGDVSALDALRILGERVGVGMANVMHIFDPDEIVVGGGVATAGDLLLEPAIAAARRLVLPGVAEHCRIRLARHGVQAGVRGAALLAAHELAESTTSQRSPTS